MHQVTLTRWAYTPFGTFGTLTLNDRSWISLEREWRNNERNVSCVPIGQYPLELTVFRRNTADTSDDYQAYELIGVPGRSKILLHVGNRQTDSAGCVLVGKDLGVLDGQWAILNSRDGFNEFMSEMEYAPVGQITITNDLQRGIL